MSYSGIRRYAPIAVTIEELKQKEIVQQNLPAAKEPITLLNKQTLKMKLNCLVRPNSRFTTEITFL